MQMHSGQSIDIDEFNQEIESLKESNGHFETQVQLLKKSSEDLEEDLSKKCAKISELES